VQQEQNEFPRGTGNKVTGEKHCVFNRQFISCYNVFKRGNKLVSTNHLLGGDRFPITGTTVYDLLFDEFRGGYETDEALSKRCIPHRVER